jgi:hypothetical protein
MLMQWINFTGLVVGFIASTAMALIGPSTSLPVTETGEGKLTFVNTPTNEQRVRNLRRMRHRECLYRLFFAALAIGFVLQGIAAWPR